MLIPFDMIAVLLYLGYYAGYPVASPPPLAESVGVVLSGGVFLLLAGAVLNRLSLRKLRKDRAILPARRSLAGTADLAVRILTILVYSAALDASAFPWSIGAAMGWDLAPESLAVQIAGLAPFVAYFFCAWLPMYGLHRETNYGTWTRVSFLVHKARYNLFMLCAWLPFAILADWFSEFVIVLPILFLAAAWSFPYLLARLWGCKPLPEGETMDMVKRLEKKAGAHFSRVYLWEPGGGGMQNAAAVGIFRPFRYLFLTPALIRNMRGPELEAVILHELGHVKNRHLLFYLFTSLAGVNLAVVIAAVLPMFGNTERFVLTVLLILGYFRLVFGWLSRNMERQADLFALAKAGSAADIANALEKLGISAGHIRRAASWHHLGIAERVDFLRRAGRNPKIVEYHNRRAGRIMAVGYAVSIAVLVGIGLLVRAELAASAPSGTERETEAHWRRVMQIMPGNATAPLELAYHLAGNPSSRREAVELATRARQLAYGAEERAAADKLARELTEADE